MIGGINLQHRTSEYSAKKANIQKNFISKEGTNNDLLKCTVQTADGRNQILYHGKDILASVGGVGGTVNVKYHKDSTIDNPIVIAWGTDIQGKEYEEVIHLNDIDIANASPAEMIALNAHLAKIGQKEVVAGGPGALWNSLGSGNSANFKMNFEQYFKDYIAMQRMANNNAGADLYQYELERYIFFANFQRE